MMEDIQLKIGRNLINENGLSPLTVSTASPDASSTTSGTPTPPDGIDDKDWAARYESIEVCEEQRQLLGTEEESSDKHSSDGEADVNDVWSITEEQHQYYETQFKSLQPDLNGVVNGYDARAYFEKSKLSVEDLRKIWQLSDVTKDGALSLSEFKIAIHLVVLKRNNIDLPSVLPESLVCTVPVPNNAAAVTISSPSLSNSESLSSPQSKGKEWTKFADSPTSTLSSPGPKPVNFDFQRPSVEQNPKILHPVAVRATPIPENAVDDVKNEIRKISITDATSTSETDPIKPIQRPQPKKPTAPGPGAIPPPPHVSAEDSINASGPTSLPVINANKKEPPPPPPPRPMRAHYRSSSLDLNKLGRIATAVPTIPPRCSPGDNPPDVQLTSNGQFAADFSQCYHGAFHVYKRTEVKSNSEAQSQEKRVAGSEICLEEKNRYLRKVCQELQEELNSLRDERIALQFKLERLHSRSPILVHSPL